MQAEIITIGDEILIGQIIDTNSAFIAKELNQIGVKVFQVSTVQDDHDHILNAFEAAEKRADLIIITGGLGPTKDDVTKQTLCHFFDDTLVEDLNVRKNIAQLFKKYQLNNPLPANFRQAMVPSKATVLNNLHGTAPGMWMERNETVFVSLPGVPYEMRYLLKEEVLPRSVSRFKRPFIYHKTLLTYGMGESAIAERIEDWETNLPADIKLAYLPALGKVRLRLSSSGENEVLLRESIDSQMEVLYNMLIDIAIGFEDETTIVGRIAHILTQKEQSLSLAESCTGGAIAKQITEEAGASAFFLGSIIPYKTELKTKLLGVPEALIQEHSVVSLEVAESMAANSVKLFNTDYAIATTGIAGPTKGDGVDEVGTVCIAIAAPRGVVSQKFNFGNDRYRVIEKTINKAFEMLLKEISKN
ncbi:competence/damage-inducible protein A [Aequorivita marina]|uniref:competence/damage-inducible protein A n=1 Tax=Aequorivita marina TaxID=3073654 RepID=UPI0028756A33|nr:competence/damage-inducible protein A [Aequorivita sp. S2608]MDS1298159.1 competence/damage-inducible protein A [Aequorivita sp. S2608]